MTNRMIAIRYIASLFGGVVICLGATLALNSLADPLWYFGGNRLGQVNFAFNERLSKVNLIAGHEGEYDCVIFGDSRATLLPVEKIKAYRCFNFAFSGGKIGEFVDYAKWLRTHGFRPRLIIVGVSAGDFSRWTPPSRVPEFVREGAAPPNPLLAYLSLDVLRMSAQALVGLSPIDRAYDREFRCVVEVKTRYDPNVPIRNLYSGPFDNEAPLAEYEALHAVFPRALFVGYAPPISAWAIAEYQRIGWLRSYTGALWRAAGMFDHFADFSVPSPMTRDPGDTYDGTHYSEGTNAGIAASLGDPPKDLALDLKTMSKEQVLQAYRSRLQ